MMRYFKDKKTGEVYAYSAGDLEEVVNPTKDSPRVFHDIAEKLKGMVELKGAELDEHLNPTPTTEQLAAIGRAERDSALQVFDTFVSNPLRYAELTEDQKTEAKTYRQALLDVPQQEGFPQEYVIPEVPDYLI